MRKFTATTTLALLSLVHLGGAPVLSAQDNQTIAQAVSGMGLRGIGPALM